MFVFISCYMTIFNTFLDDISHIMLPIYANVKYNIILYYRLINSEQSGYQLRSTATHTINICT